MKKLCLAIITTVSIFTLSCKKERPLCCILPSRPQIVAEKNNQAWEAGGYTEKFDTDSLSIIGRRDEERLIMRIKFAGKGIYTLQGKQAYYYTTVGQDVIVSEYAVDETAVNSIEITDYDNNKNTIKGTYSLTLKKLYANPTDSYPNTTRFVNGKFEVVLAP